MQKRIYWTEIHKECPHSVVETPNSPSDEKDHILGHHDLVVVLHVVEQLLDLEGLEGVFLALVDV